MPDDLYRSKRTVKCALKGLFTKDVDKQPLIQKFNQQLEQTMVMINQLRVLASFVIKHHLFTTMELHNTIPWKINQNYLSDVFRCLRGKKLNQKTKTTVKKGVKTKQILNIPYTESLPTSVKFIIDTVNPLMAKTTMSQTALCQIIQYACRGMYANYKVHLKERVVQAFQCWTNNQIRCLMTEKERMAFRRYGKSYKDRIETLPFYSRYQAYNTILETLITEEDDETVDEEGDEEEESKFDYSRAFEFMYRLKRDSEVLENTTQIKMKGIAVFPQNRFHLGSIRLDSFCMAAIYCSLRDEKGLNCIQLSKVENQDIAWNALFDMKAIKKLRTNWMFGYSINTDGVYAAVSFEKDKKVFDTTKRFKPSIEELPNGFYKEKDILEKYANNKFDILSSFDSVDWVAIDPGIKSLLTGWNMNNDEEVFTLKQKTYKHESGMNMHNKISTKRYERNMSDVKAVLDEVPYKNYVGLNRMTEYLKAIRGIWVKLWSYKSSEKIRMTSFIAWRKRQSFIDKFLNILLLRE